MNNFTLCAHDIIKAALVMGALGSFIAVWTGAMVLASKYGGGI